MLPRVKKMWDEYRHMNYLKLHGGVDPCAAPRARLAEVEAQRDGIASALRQIIDSGEIPYCESSYLVLYAREALAKLEEK